MRALAFSRLFSLALAVLFSLSTTSVSRAASATSNSLSDDHIEIDRPFVDLTVVALQAGEPTEPIDEPLLILFEQHKSELISYVRTLPKNIAMLLAQSMTRAHGQRSE